MLADLKFGEQIGNPLDVYPNRDWEKIYRQQFGYDSSFHFLCAPNDTHNCLLKAYVKNGVITRIGPSYGYGKAQDIYGNCASSRWEPRLCQKGLALHRRIQGPRRVKYPMLRQGFKEWVDAGFPRADDGKVPGKYLQRGKEPFIKISWDQAFDYAARTLVNIATTYSGSKGAELLRRQGYEPESIQAMQQAGTQVLKFRGGMPLLGITRVFGMYRLANSMALLDEHIRKVGPDKALGGRGWDNYSWHTDLPPGHPMVTGQQTVDFDLVDAENARLIIPWGMNWISTKMPDSHWLTEARIKGAKVITITVEYSSVANKCDEVVIIRPATDPAFALGVAQVLISEKLYDKDYVTAKTDLPFLVRMDNLKMVRAEDVFPDFKPPQTRRDTWVLKNGEKKPTTIQAGERQCIAEELLAQWGNFVVWDSKAKAPAAVSREDVGKYFQDKGVEPQLTGEFELSINGAKVKVRPAFDLLWQYLRDNFDLATTEKITWAPVSAITSVARQLAENAGKTLIAVGMGPQSIL